MTRKWNPFTRWWLLWGAAFLAIETTAVLNRRKSPGGTLSSLVWRFIDPKHPVRRWVFIAGWVALSGHFLWDWFNF